MPREGFAPVLRAIHGGVGAMLRRREGARVTVVQRALVIPVGAVDRCAGMVGELRTIITVPWKSPRKVARLGSVMQESWGSRCRWFWPCRSLHRGGALMLVPASVPPVGDRQTPDGNAIWDKPWVCDNVVHRPVVDVVSARLCPSRIISLIRISALLGVVVMETVGVLLSRRSIFTY